MENIQEILYDTIIDAPLQFSVEGKAFCLHPKSLGMIILLDRQKERLEIDSENIKANPTLEMLRVCKEKKEVVLRMIAYNVLNDKDKIFNPVEVESMMGFFRDNLTVDDMATLLTHILRDEHDVTKILRGHFKIDDELGAKRELSNSRKGNSIVFGGKTIFGTLFDFIAQRYGWTIHQMVWETSYNNLMMMYYDHADSIYLSDEEKKHLSGRLRNWNDEVIEATKNNMELIKSMNWK